ncbi:MAG: hypothetical protein RL115_1918 [Bacteroidota bacterium]|jgi:hypothetical protein
MTGEIALAKLIKQMKPELQSGTYIFCSTNNHPSILLQDAIMMFKEKEGITMVISKEVADKHNIPYSFVTAWITLTVHSSLEAIGLTAAFSKALADEAISCNVVAGYFHDHIFVNQDKAELAMATLKKLSETA